MKEIFKWLITTVFFGTIILFVVNMVGVYININIPINLINILIVGILRVPGLVLLYILLAL